MNEQQERTPVDGTAFMADGNVFAVLGVASKALKRAGRRDDAAAMSSAVFGSESYDAALAIILRYVEPVFGDEEDA